MDDLPMSNPLSETRRRNFVSYVDNNFENQEQAGETLGIASTYVSFLCTGRKALGEKLARRMETSAGLDPGYFDRDLDSGAAPLLDRLSARMRDDPALRVLVQFILDDPETPLPEGVRDSLRPLLNGLKLAVSNAAFPETRTAGRPLPVPAAFRNT